MGAMGFEGMAANSHGITFDPNAPAFKAKKLQDVISSVLHVLENMGPYAAAHSSLHAFKWLVAGAPDAAKSAAQPNRIDTIQTSPDVDAAKRAKQDALRLRELLRKDAEAAGYAWEGGLIG
jgi:hypothetical protein